MRGPYISLSFAIILALAALAALAVAFGTNHWNVYAVDIDGYGASLNPAQSAAQLQGDDSRREYRTRYRGIWQNCYSYTSAAGDSVYECSGESGYQLNSNPLTGYSDEYKIRVHLLRLMFALFVITLALEVLLLLWTAGIVCVNSRRNVWGMAILAFVANFTHGIAMGVYNAVDYLERVRITDDQSFYAAIATGTGYTDFKNYVDYSFGYSYMLSWISLGLMLFSSILYMRVTTRLVRTGADGTQTQLFPRRGGGGRRQILVPPDKYYSSLAAPVGMSSSPYAAYANAIADATYFNYPGYSY